MGGSASWNAVDSGVFGYLAHYHLGEVYAQQNRLAEAEAQWRQVLAERPGYVNAWLRLGDLWGRQGRAVAMSELEDAAQRLEAAGEMRMICCCFGFSQIGRRDYGAARQLVAEAVAREPSSLPRRVLLSQVLLQEGRDWDAAEKALNEILALDPQNQEARHNLTVPRR